MENEQRIEELENRFADLEAKLKAVLRENENVDVPMPVYKTLFVRYHGEMQGHAVLTWGFLAFLTFLAVGSLLAFLATDSMKMQLLWTTIFLVCIINTVLMKLWYWLIWNRYSVVREVKRLELRVVELIEKLEKH